MDGDAALAFLRQHGRAFLGGGDAPPVLRGAHLSAEHRAVYASNGVLALRLACDGIEATETVDVDTGEAISGQYPADRLEEMFARKMPTEARTEDAEKALRRVKAVVAATRLYEDVVMRESARVALEVGGFGTLQVVAEDEGGELLFRAMCGEMTRVREPGGWCVNGRYLLAALRAIRACGSRRLEWGFGDHRAPIRISGDGVAALVSPIIAGGAVHDGGDG